MAHIRQSRPDSGLGCQRKVLEAFLVVPSSLGSGEGAGCVEREQDFFSDSLLIRVHLVVEMIRFGGPASRHGSYNSLFQVALYLPPQRCTDLQDGAHGGESVVLERRARLLHPPPLALHRSLLDSLGFRVESFGFRIEVAIRASRL